MAKNSKKNKKKQSQANVKKDPNVSKWMKRLHKEASIRRKFRRSCDRIEQIYTGDVAPYSNNTEEDAHHEYNILWVNCEILISALYSRNPSPDVRRRHKDSIDRMRVKKAPPQEQQQVLQEEQDRVELYNEIGKKVSMLMERSLTYVQDTQDYFGNAKDSVLSFIKFAAGQERVRYKVYTSQGKSKRFKVEKDEEGNFKREDGEEILDLTTIQSEEAAEGEELGGFFIESEDEFEEDFEHEELVNEWVPIENFRWEPNAEWPDVGWAVIEHYMNEEELEEEFGEDVAARIPLTYTNEGQYVEYKQRDKNTQNPTQALIYECFDKRERKVEVFAKDLDEILDDQGDPYNLENFYPFPKPMFGTMGDSNINPVADYLYYQDQHTELNTLTFRINILLEAIKYRGFYDGSLDKLIDVENQGDGQFKALANFAQLAAMDGGSFDLKNYIAVMPMAEATALLERMYGWREQTKRIIHEITGISDIARGSSMASETLGAQELKAQYTNLRLQTKTKEVERFFRDIKRIEAEFLSEHFDTETLEGMTGMEVTEEMEEVLSSDLLRSYIVDVETDSTVIMDSAVEQRERSEALAAMTRVIAEIAPGVQMGIIPPDMAGELILFGLKGFKGARELEDKIQEALDGAVDALPPQGAPGAVPGAIPGPPNGATGGVVAQGGPPNLQAVPTV